MQRLRSFFSQLFLSPRFFQVLIAIIFVFIASFIYQPLLEVGKLLFFVFVGIVIIDLFLLFSTQGILAEREAPEKFSNGDENSLKIWIKNSFAFWVFLRIIDELPIQFQKRDFSIFSKLAPRSEETISYQLRPVKRGEYHFGALHVFVATSLGLVRRRFSFSKQVMVPVYPAFLQLRKYEFMAFSNRLTEIGVKKIRRLGNNQEFEQIKEYVQGDDIRTINWKATARKRILMVNRYQDEKSQPVYSIICKGRTMKMPFEGLSLLDYAINASLVLSRVALLRDDKAGLITFSHKIDTILPANRTGTQMHKIMENLYKQKTAYKDPDYEKLYTAIKRTINQRSLLLLYTHFESFNSMQRQLNFFRKIAAHHVLIIVFFENTELSDLLQKEAESIEEIYDRTIAEKFAFEKRQIVKELHKHGIQAILTAPENLTVNSINKYLEIKARGLI